jgi:hypothetical protein
MRQPTKLIKEDITVKHHFLCHTRERAPAPSPPERSLNCQPVNGGFAHPVILYTKL